MKNLKELIVKYKSIKDIDKKDFIRIDTIDVKSSIKNSLDKIKIPDIIFNTNEEKFLCKELISEYIGAISIINNEKLYGQDKVLMAMGYIRGIEKTFELLNYNLNELSNYFFKENLLLFLKMESFNSGDIVLKNKDLYLIQDKEVSLLLDFKNLNAIMYNIKGEYDFNLY